MGILKSTIHSPLLQCFYRYPGEGGYSQSHQCSSHYFCLHGTTDLTVANGKGLPLCQPPFCFRWRTFLGNANAVEFSVRLRKLHWKWFTGIRVILTGLDETLMYGQLFLGRYPSRIVGRHYKDGRCYAALCRLRCGRTESSGFHCTVYLSPLTRYPHQRLGLVATLPRPAGHNVVLGCDQIHTVSSSAARDSALQTGPYLTLTCRPDLIHKFNTSVIYVTCRCLHTRLSNEQSIEIKVIAVAGQSCL